MTSMQTFLAHATAKAATELSEALLRLPADKRNWKPAETSRSAADTLAECALLNGQTAEVIDKRSFSETFDFAGYEREKGSLAQDEESLIALLEKNSAYAVAMIESVADEDLSVEVQMPWGPMALSEIIAYPHWNMSYHLGQVNYIASLLDCLR